MKKYIGYIPAIIFTALYLMTAFRGMSIATSMILVWLACFWIAAFLLHKRLFWGGIFGMIPASNMIYNGTKYLGQGINIDILVGVLLLLFYIVLFFYLWKNRDADIPKVETKELLIMFVKMVLTIIVVIVSSYVAVVSGMILLSKDVHPALVYIGMLVLPSLLLPLIWLKKRKRFIIGWLIVAVLYFIAVGVNYGLERYDDSITINMSANINVHEYLPFEENSKIVKIDSKTLKLTENLPKIDGAAAFFPVYSAFVNAVYPNTTKLYEGVFEYNNTPGGYQLLAEKGSDIFIGVYPSEEQKAYAKECNTTFEYTPIGTEAFVFFVHKDNPIDNLTTEQIQGIYSGEITNWKQVGGRNEKIAAFQRNEGSGSQSMLKRFMGDKPIMEAPTELVNNMMSGIIEKVSNYKSKSNSIGFSFRFYVEGIIQNPDIKMLSVDGVAPTAENIKNGSYSIVTPMYAVTYEENTNENVDKLLEWILSEEGQYIIEETGYVGMNNIVDSTEDIKNNETYYPHVNPEDGEVYIIVKKADRLLEVWQSDKLISSFSIGLGWNPEGHKQMEGDGKTPEGEYYVCVKNRNSSFYLSLGVSYPNKEDAAVALEDGRIDRDTYESIARAIDNGQCPDWYTALGGEIMIHGHGGSSDWTAGCVAVDNEVMDFLFDCCSIGTRITILP